MQSNLPEKLGNHALFGVLPARAIASLLDASLTITHPAGALIFSKGDKADAVFIILDGEISIEVASLDGRIANIAVLSPLDIMGEFTVLDGGRRSANARSLSKLTLLSISKIQFLQLVADHPEFSVRLIRFLIQRLRESDVLIETISLMSLRQRTSRLLLRLADGGVAVKITQSQLAERLSASREKVNGHLRWLQDIGAIGLGRGTIDIKDIERLKKIAEDT